MRLLTVVSVLILPTRVRPSQAPTKSSGGRGTPMYRLLAFVLAVTILIAHSGCTTAVAVDPRRFRLPPPPSEATRSQFGVVRISAGSSAADLKFVGPAKGAGEGAMRGSMLGGLGPIVLGAQLGPGGVMAGILLAPVGAVVGAVAGAVRAEPTATVEEKEAAVRKTLGELKIQEEFLGCVTRALRAASPQIAVADSGTESPSTILEVAIEMFGLDAGCCINPPLTYVVAEHTRLIRGSDGAELYSHWLTYRGRTRPLDEWVAQDGTLLKEEAGRVCISLAEWLVDEVFLLYLPTEEGRAKR